MNLLLARSCSSNRAVALLSLSLQYLAFSQATGELVQDRGVQCGLECRGNYNVLSFDECLRNLTESVTVFEDESDNGEYDFARRTTNSRFNAQQPHAIIYARDVDQVKESLNCARVYGFQVSAAGGRHSYQGSSVNNGGLVIDVSNMTTFEIDSDNGFIRVGAGLQGGAVVAALASASSNIWLPTGMCPFVGISGFTLGGGIGLLGRYLGLMCDNLVSIEAVDAMGTIVTANATHNSDLFWASCGGGGGNFALVTEFRFRINQLPNNGRVTYIQIEYNPGVENIVDAFMAFQEWLPSMPNEFGAYIEWKFQRMFLTSIFIGNKSEATELLKRNRILNNTSNVNIAEIDSYFGYVTDKMANLWLSGLLPARSNAESYIMNTLQMKEGYYRAPGMLGNYQWLMSSSRMPKILPLEEVRELAQYTYDMGESTMKLNGTISESDGLFMTWFWVLGGAIRSKSPDETAFRFRDADYVMEGSLFFPGEATRAAYEQEYSDMMDGWTAIASKYLPKEQPAYVNYLNTPSELYQLSYYGENYDRLSQIKQAYDPAALFWNPYGVEGNPEIPDNAAVVDAGDARASSSAMVGSSMMLTPLFVLGVALNFLLI